MGSLSLKAWTTGTSIASSTFHAATLSALAGSSGDVGTSDGKARAPAVKVSAQTSPLSVPYITWGGDMATFYANGGLVTKPGTIFEKQGLNLKLQPGDDFCRIFKIEKHGADGILPHGAHAMGEYKPAFAGFKW